MKRHMITIYDRVGIVFDKLANEEYPKLTMKRKKELFNDFGIDSGTDYARYILKEIIYDENGESSH